MKLKLKKKTRRKLLKRLKAIREEVEIDYGHMRGATSELLDELIDELSPPADPTEAKPLEADVAVTFYVKRGPWATRPETERYPVGEEASLAYPTGYAASVEVHNMGPAQVNACWTSSTAIPCAADTVALAPGMSFVFQLHPGDLRHEPLSLIAVAR